MSILYNFQSLCFHKQTCPYLNVIFLKFCRPGLVDTITSVKVKGLQSPKLFSAPPRKSENYQNTYFLEDHLQKVSLPYVGVKNNKKFL